MSTKIYTGFRFRSHDMFEIHGLIARWRDSLVTFHNDEMAVLLASMCAETIDRNVTEAGRNAGKYPYRDAHQEIRTRQKEILGSGARDPEVDFDFEVSILPHDGAVYGMIFSERSRWIDLWMEQEEVEDFSYWNNVDRPSDISEDEWKERSETWSRILRSNAAGTPGMVGFSAQCTDRFVQPTLADVVDQLPSFEERLKKQSRSSAITRVFYKMKDDGFDLESPFAVLRKIELWLDGEGAHVQQEETSRLAVLLPKQIDAEMLTSPLPQAVGQSEQDPSGGK
jgi:hypothetical protein